MDMVNPIINDRHEKYVNCNNARLKHQYIGQSSNTIQLQYKIINLWEFVQNSVEKYLFMKFIHQHYTYDCSQLGLETHWILSQ
jgi:hypothetical protein